MFFSAEDLKLKSFLWAANFFSFEWNKTAVGPLGLQLPESLRGGGQFTSEQPCWRPPHRPSASRSERPAAPPSCWPWPRGAGCPGSQTSQGPGCCVRRCCSSAARTRRRRRSRKSPAEKMWSTGRSEASERATFSSPARRGLKRGGEDEEKRGV